MPFFDFLKSPKPPLTNEEILRNHFITLQKKYGNFSMESSPHSHEPLLQYLIGIWQGNKRDISYENKTLFSLNINSVNVAMLIHYFFLAKNISTNDVYETMCQFWSSRIAYIDFDPLTFSPGESFFTFCEVFRSVDVMYLSEVIVNSGNSSSRDAMIMSLFDKGFMGLGLVGLCPQKVSYLIEYLKRIEKSII